MKIKTTLMFHLTPLRMNKIEKMTTNAGLTLGKGGHSLLVGLQTGTAVMEVSAQVPQKVEEDLPCNPITSSGACAQRAPYPTTEKRVCSGLLLLDLEQPGHGNSLDGHQLVTG